MPFVTYGHYNSWMHDKVTSSVGNAIDPGLGVSYADEIYLIDQSRQERVKDNFYSIGARYDLTSNMALKFDWTHYHSDYRTPDDPAIAASQQLLKNAGLPDTFSPAPDANRVSAAITFAF
jgi:hypothetical protein